MSNIDEKGGDDLGEAIRAVLHARARRGASLDELAAVLAGPFTADATLRALVDLQKRGLAVEWSRRWYAPSFTEWRIGNVDKRVGRDAVVRVGETGAGGGERSYHVREAQLRDARVGDRVLIKRLRQSRHRHRSQPEAAVVRILERGIQNLVGTLEVDDQGRRRLVPFEPALDIEVRIDGAEDLEPGDYVVVRLAEEASGGHHLSGEVVEVLGPIEKPGVDTLVILRQHQIPERFPDGVLVQAEAFPDDPGPEDWLGRRDLRDRMTVTIDGASARDYDDAISVEPLEGGRYRLGVHIADVSHYVTEGGEIDAEAYRRGTSVYFPERAVPMLPESLSNGLCSLRPDVPRLTMSAFLTFGRDGRVVERSFCESVIQSRHRLTYDEVRDVLAGQPASVTGELLTLLRDAERLMQRLHERRCERGSLDFDLPAGDVILDTDGFTVGVRPGDRHCAHRMIEEFMIAANEAVAQALSEAGVGTLFRVHDAPSPKKLEELREFLEGVGLTLRLDEDGATPVALQELLRQVEGRPEEQFISALVLRTMQRASYSPECRGHFALSSEYYTHFTSPIRRYPDLVVHRRLKSLVRARDEASAVSNESLGDLTAAAEHTSFTERRAEQAERDLLQWKKVRFLADRIGDVFSGRVTGVQPFGMFVQLDDLYVDGLVPIRSLTDDYYVYEEERHTLTGEGSGRRFRLADAVEVILTGVSERHRGLDLAIRGMPEPKTPDRGPRRHGRPGRETGPRRGSGKRQRSRSR